MRVEVSGNALWLGKVSKLWKVGREEAEFQNQHVAEPNPISPLLLLPSLCEERVWPEANVQVWVLVIGLLPTVAKVKLLLAFCCCFLIVTVKMCSSAIQCIVVPGFHSGMSSLSIYWTFFQFVCWFVFPASCWFILLQHEKSVSSFQSWSTLPNKYKAF